MMKSFARIQRGARSDAMPSFLFEVNIMADKNVPHAVPNYAVKWPNGAPAFQQPATTLPRIYSAASMRSVRAIGRYAEAAERAASQVPRVPGGSLHPHRIVRA
jgi:hypothetical protein